MACAVERLTVVEGDVRPSGDGPRQVVGRRGHRLGEVGLGRGCRRRRPRAGRRRRDRPGPRRREAVLARVVAVGLGLDAVDEGAAGLRIAVGGDGDVGTQRRCGAVGVAVAPAAAVARATARARHEREQTGDRDGDDRCPSSVCSVRTFSAHVLGPLGHVVPPVDRPANWSRLPRIALDCAVTPATGGLNLGPSLAGCQLAPRKDSASVRGFQGSLRAKVSPSATGSITVCMRGSDAAWSLKARIASVSPSRSSASTTRPPHSTLSTASRPFGRRRGTSSS